MSSQNVCLKACQFLKLLKQIKSYLKGILSSLSNSPALTVPSFSKTSGDREGDGLPRASGQSVEVNKQGLRA